ncbi:MAG: hypothetical protein J1E84_07665 [Muribaculaceae bacterium]|nr:hypothetical protein [Muribaculaceae bacterium]
MAHTFCPECGHPFQGNETSCPECGYVFARHNNNTEQPSQTLVLDEGDNSAEDILRKWIKWIKLIIIIVSCISGGIMMFLGIAAASSYYGNFGMALLGILGGAITILFGWLYAQLTWATGMIFINISTNVRIIKHRLR